MLACMQSEVRFHAPSGHDTTTLICSVPLCVNGKPEISGRSNTRRGSTVMSSTAETPGTAVADVDNNGDASRDQCYRRPWRRHQPARRNINRSSGFQTHISDAATVGFRTAHLFEKMDSVDEVSQFLRELGLGQYVDTFRKHAVTGELLLSLNGVELSKTLKIKSIRHRRVILNGVSFLRQNMATESKIVLPEDGRILNHLANERTVLAWLRLAIIMQTGSVAIVRFPQSGSFNIDVSVVVSSIVIAFFAFVACAYAVYRYFLMMRMIESAGWDISPESATFFTPSLAIAVIIILSTYFVMARNAEEVAALLMLSV